MIDLEKLERLAKAATQGPWEVDELNNIRIAPKGRLIVATIHDYEDYLPRMDDTQYIVASCNAVPTLITDNRALQKRVKELEVEANFLASRLANQNPNCDCGDVRYWRNWAWEKRENQASTHQPVQVSRTCSEDMPEPEEESND